MNHFDPPIDNGPWTTFYSDIKLMGGKATSAFYTPLKIGNYCFRAVYSGDKNY
jgi:hypothetical protein